ncbi:MAG: hypothetical protein IPG02_12455 [Ignavibacteria bacterium]|nr:hypothetical protein [Ignavibacteria bacterium]
MRILLIFIFFSCISKTALADASPFYSNAKIDIEYSYPDTVSLLECCVIYQSALETTDTSCNNNKSSVYVAVCEKERIKIIRSIPEKFRLMLRFSNGVVTTPELHKNGMNSYHRILIDGNSARDITPVFRTTYSNYSIALLATLILELIVAGIFFFFAKIPMRYLFVIALLNLITHPLLWLITSNLTGYGTALIFLEALITAAETYAIYRFLKGKISLLKAMVLSIIMNLVSFIVGGGIYLLFA